MFKGWIGFVSERIFSFHLETGILVGRRRRQNQVGNSIDHLEEESVETDSIRPVGFLLREEDE
jgi:hypothetical protein